MTLILMLWVLSYCSRQLVTGRTVIPWDPFGAKKIGADSFKPSLIYGPKSQLGKNMFFTNLVRWKFFARNGSITPCIIFINISSDPCYHLERKRLNNSREEEITFIFVFYDYFGWFKIMYFRALTKWILDDFFHFLTISFLFQRGNWHSSWLWCQGVGGRWQW